MAFQKGNKLGKGRPKGSENKTTQEIKDMISAVVAGQVEHWKNDMEKIRKKNPEEAIRLTAKFIDYVLPKQTKVELEGELSHKVEKVVIEVKKNEQNNTHPNND
jgi:uncharacterized protein YdeI (BOF family)